ncbi:MAG: VCBS repeat-containing protein [Candidatus Midichloria sp.]|nr:VCBS repeat-containing protein [Candidatus Midichloria sp.]
MILIAMEKQDIVSTNQGAATISVLIGNGDGAFQPAIPYNIGSAPIKIATGDFNRDVMWWGMRLL